VALNVSRSLLMYLPELVELQRLALHSAKDLVRTKELAYVKLKDFELPIMSFEFGSQDQKAPVFLLTGGVHGLERIGTRVIISFLKTLTNLAYWDTSTQHLLSKVRFVVIPIINPSGMYLGWRSNANGVDIMRNAPVEADAGGSIGIAAGHRISKYLPWYRGSVQGGLETETRSLITFFEDSFASSKSVLALDVHSGFGSVDRIWFPYARTKVPFPNLREVFQLTHLLDHVYPHHIYRVEPQSQSYTTHGDVWDYLYDRRRIQNGSLFLPLTLELGSWLWIKKNPRQLFSALGIFNPLLPHRTSRILRRHLNLLDFLLRCAASPEAWSIGKGVLHDPEEVERMARARWYNGIAA
jgi:Zinc carboxypeptidase